MSKTRYPRLRALGCFLVLFALSAIAGTPAAAQELLILVRHAEQLRDAGDDPPLAEHGERRAAQLAALLADVDLTGIYTSELARARQTAAPLADRLGLAPVVVPHDDLAGVVDRVRREQPTGRVLIVGHSNTVPELLALLGHDAVQRIESDDYDNIFIVVPADAGPPAVVRLRLVSP